MERTNTTRHSHTPPQRARWLLVVLASALSGACATASAVVRPPATSVPSAWSRSVEGTTTSVEDLARWWERLCDPVLTGVVEQALKANPDLRIATARLRQAQARRNLAQANLLPSVSASGSVSGVKRSQSDATADLSASIDASWEPDIFGGLRSAVVAARADLAATEEDLHNTQVSLAAEVAVNYVDLRDYQARLAIAQANLATQRETLQLTEWRAQAGLVSSVDVEQARASAAQTSAQIPSLQTNIVQAEHRLAALAGLQPTSLAKQLDASAPIPAVPDGIAVGIPAESLRQRPDVRAAEQRVLAETARLAEAKAARYPSFSLRGSLGTDVVTGALTGGTSFVASLVGSVAQTIFDGGRIRQQIEIQGAAQEQAVISYESTVLTALEDVENALVALEQDRQRLAALTIAVGASRNAALLSRQQYAAGLADFQTVLDTQRSVLTAEETLSATEANRTTDLIQLYKALGGGWSPTERGPQRGTRVGVPERTAPAAGAGTR
jgi:multidrug efflux system outer membrane protein